MRTFVAAITLALTACSPPAQQTVEQPAAANDTRDITEIPITREQLVGRWGDNGDCTQLITINADNTYTFAYGSSGTWTLEGDVMTLTSVRGAFPVRVSLLNDHTLLIGNADGSIGMSQRC